MAGKILPKMTPFWQGGGIQMPTRRTETGLYEPIGIKSNVRTLDHKPRSISNLGLRPRYEKHLGFMVSVRNYYLFVPGYEKNSFSTRENGEIWPEAHDRKRVFMNPEG